MREKILPRLPRGVILAQIEAADKMSQSEFVWAIFAINPLSTNQPPHPEPRIRR